MKNRALFLQFFGVQILILLGAIGFVAGYTWFSVREAFYRQWSRELETQSHVLAVVLPDIQGELNQSEVDRFFSRIAGMDGHRFTLIQPDGKVIADTEVDVKQLGLHNDRPEVRDALEKGRGRHKRYSANLDQQILYLAQRIPLEGPAKAVIRVAVPESMLLREFSVSNRMILVISMVVFMAALAMSYLMSLRTIGPVSDIQKGVQQLGQGDFSFRLAIPPVPHLAMLARSINQMAEQIEKLSTIRQDFVANVSHELRTPVTSIKGFAEALLDGAKDSPADCERFLGIIMRQANQLESIIHDLLELSDMEQNSVQNLEKHPTDLEEIITNVTTLCQSRAESKGFALCVSCERGLTANIHSGLVEQALLNLIDNAIKYGATSDQPIIDISAYCAREGVELTVRDYGHGIEESHLDRLFERFYRVDKGRSREMGGTGLGLAIVKHIALIHGGTVRVKSEQGKGSAFTITLPV
jgi:two-component system phosphate regulon sensor histidine kinase PhoR